jgi:hypothetical protein
MSRQPSSRGDGFPVPRAHRQRCARGGDGLEPRARQQSQTDAACDAALTPCSWHLQRARPLGDIEVGLAGPAVGIRAADLVGGQLPGGCADPQRSLVRRVLPPHDSQEGPGDLAEVQISPAPHSPHAVLNPERRVFVRASFWPLRARMQPGAMPRRATTFAWTLRGRGTATVTFLRKRPTSASGAVAARNCSTVARPASTQNSRVSGLFGRAAKTFATASWPVAPQ